MFDRNKGALYALYGRALREKPELAGKLVLEFTIAPTGEITNVRVVSSELNDPELEKKIVARVRQIRFKAGGRRTVDREQAHRLLPGGLSPRGGSMNLQSEVDYYSEIRIVGQGSPDGEFPVRADV